MASFERPLICNYIYRRSERKGGGVGPVLLREWGCGLGDRDVRYFIYCFRPNIYTVVVISAKLEVSCVNYKETEKH